MPSKLSDRLLLVKAYLSPLARHHVVDELLGQGDLSRFNP